MIKEIPKSRFRKTLKYTLTVCVIVQNQEDQKDYKNGITVRIIIDTLSKVVKVTVESVIKQSVWNLNKEYRKKSKRYIMALIKYKN